MILTRAIWQSNFQPIFVRKMSFGSRSIFSEEGKQALFDKIPMLALSGFVGVIGYTAIRVHDVDKEIWKVNVYPKKFKNRQI